MVGIEPEMKKCEWDDQNKHHPNLIVSLHLLPPGEINSPHNPAAGYVWALGQ
jgi:hypothetical protein